MNINFLETGNLIIVFVLLFFIARKRDVTSLLMVLFTYGALHFSFAAVTLFFDGWAEILNAFHAEGGGIIAKLSVLIILIITFGLLGINAYREFKKAEPETKRLGIGVCTASVLVLLGYLVNIRFRDWLQLKNILAIVGMFLLVLFGFLGSFKKELMSGAVVSFWAKIGIGILLVANAIGFYEVSQEHTWALTVESSGVTVHRASSLIFNPNLFAFWASLVYLAFAFGMRKCREQTTMMLFGMVLASVAIYLSGARSSSYLLLGLLILSLLMLRDRKQIYSVLVLPLTIVTSYMASSAIQGADGTWFNIALVGERFVLAPKYLINYVLIAFGLPGFFSVGLPHEVSKSIEGRFAGEMTDCAWIVLYQDAGWLGELGMVSIFLILLFWSARAFYSERKAESVFALLVLLCCSLTGLVMRFQIFPVWIFIGVGLVPCVVFWRRIGDPSTISVSKKAQ